MDESRDRKENEEKSGDESTLFSSPKRAADSSTGCTVHTNSTTVERQLFPSTCKTGIPVRNGIFCVRNTYVSSLSLHVRQ